MPSGGTRDRHGLSERFTHEALLHLRELTHAARQLTRDPARADDLVQETFLQAWRSFHTFEAGTNCRAWLYKILFRTLTRSLRQQPREYSLSDHPHLEAHAMAKPETRDPIARRRLRTVFEDLSDNLRTVVLLADVYELRYREIADALDVPIGTVMSRLNRARKQLREAWHADDLKGDAR